MLKLICLLSVALTGAMIPFGAFVRLKNAGLSCPDWPLCYGQLLPPEGFEIALETGHRFVGFILGILIIAINFVAFLQPRYSKLRKLALTTFILVSIQGILGALTVTMVLWPPIVTLHLLGGNILLGILVYLTVLSFYTSEEKSKIVEGTPNRLNKNKSKEKKRMFWMLAILLIMITSGGYNSTTSSGYHCEAFPGCHEKSAFSFGMSGTDVSALSGIEGHILSPAPKEFQGRFLPVFENEWIHMLHRLIAICGGMILILMSWFWLKNKQDYKLIGISFISLIILEILIGIINAVLRLPAPVSATHTAIAAILTSLLFFILADIQIKNEN